MDVHINQVLAYSKRYREQIGSFNNVSKSKGSRRGSKIGHLVSF